MFYLYNLQLRYIILLVVDIGHNYQWVTIPRGDHLGCTKSGNHQQSQVVAPCSAKLVMCGPQRSRKWLPAQLRYILSY